MRLYDEIFKSAEGVALSRFTIVPRGGGYFEGVKAVGEFSTEKILLLYPKAVLEIDGENLSIGKYVDGDLKIEGKVRAVSLVDGGNGK